MAIQPIQPNFKFELGDELRDELTGFKGIVVCRTQWLNACNVYGLQSQKLKEGKPMDRQHFDEPQLVCISKSTTVDDNGDKKRPGGEAPAVYQANR